MISVEGVTKRYGDVVAVEDLSFEVSRGEVVGFLGPNGAGKSTTMRMITGTLQPDEGNVRFDGEPIAEDLVAAKRRVGYLPESNPLYDELLVADYLTYVADLRGMDAPAARSGIADAVEETDIASVFYRPVGECSKGYRQRIGLAAAILHRPEVLVLDEPTEGLDPNQRVEIRRLVGALGRERTVLLSTHVMQEVESTCSRLVILRRGRLAADGRVDELVAHRTAGVRYVVEAEGEGVAEALEDLPGVSDHSVRSVEGRTRVELHSREARELRPQIFALARDRGWSLWELHREKASLEQLFQDLTREERVSGGEDADGEVAP
ncbi:MAG: ATP-binding cassette domain-containing protein [Longimicrobiales bacterium]|nr:ATP-binding cassette domain-containing protein [Longimicrobiales bacterium]